MNAEQYVVSVATSAPALKSRVKTAIVNASLRGCLPYKLVHTLIQLLKLRSA